ncbi:MAG: YunC family protein [Fibrobacterota bacterium]
MNRSDQPDQFRIDLAKPLLLLRGRRGILACAYLNVDTAEKTGEAMALVSGVATFEDMKKARITAVSTPAARLGVRIGMSGSEALRIFS